MENSKLMIALPVIATVNKKATYLRSALLALQFITPKSSCKNKGVTLITCPLPNTS